MESGNTGNGHALSSAFSESRHAKEEADRLAEAIRRARVEWEAVLRETFKRQPYASIAVAAGVGYIIGGGLAPGVVRTAVGTGTRMALGLVLERLFASPSHDAFRGEEFHTTTE